MSYITLPSGVPDARKIVISFWFRIPNETFSQIRFNDTHGTGAGELANPPIILNGILPLVTWGRPQTSKGRTYTTQVGTRHLTESGLPPIGGGPATEPVYGAAVDSRSWLIDPCYIGTDRYGNLVINIQMADHANYENVDWSLTSWRDEYTSTGYSQWLTYTDLSYVNALTPESFHQVLNINLAPDKWHHVLISLDFSQTITTEWVPFDTYYPDYSTATMTKGAIIFYIAVDDVNYDSDYFADFIDGQSNKNAYLTDTAWHIANTGWWESDFVDGNTPHYIRTPAVDPHPGMYSWTPAGLPLDKAHLGIPCTPDHADRIYKIEMAELQIFPGIVLDTNVVANRRLFITVDGMPVNPAIAAAAMSTMVIGDPTTWEPGADILPPTPDPGGVNVIKGVRPAIAFTESSQNWITGNNLGSAPGRVATTGKITEYFPNPQLGK